MGTRNPVKPKVSIRRAFTIAERVKVCDLFKEYRRKLDKEQFSDETIKHFLACELLRSFKKIEWALEGETKWRQELSRLKVTQGCVRRGTIEKKFGKGKRARGAGPKAKLSIAYPLVKDWLDKQRRCGYFVDQEDLVRQFEHILMKFKEKLEARKGLMGLSIKEEGLLLEIEIESKKLADNKGRTYWKERLKIETKARFS